ncbi:hypothetical protein [Clostridium tunisiense]|uniref:hypothetical protein n=1 Tax=Clostridium tunisiense TaxID=219748 RepID=UPI0002DEEDFA|nr:hypothetical protein [Clostridium tunisiense]
MSNKISLIINVLCVVWLGYSFITSRTSGFGNTFHIVALVVLTVSSYTHYVSMRKTSTKKV